MRRLSAALAGAALTCALTTAGAVAAPAQTDDGDGTASEAELPGLPEGGAYMGWSLDAQREADPQTFAFEGGLQPTEVQAQAARPSGVPGIDVSAWQGNVAWDQRYADGNRFAYIKATEGVAYRNPYFSQQYNGSYEVGMIRGAYHFGRPDINATARQQAEYFVAHGGGWSGDGQTLPGALDIEYNPVSGGDKCYGLTSAQMVAWVQDFVARYTDLTGREPVIYTNRDWWASCTGDSTALAGSSSLWTARWSTQVGTLPGGWSSHTFWQYTNTPIDQNVFNGTLAQLRSYAAHSG